MKDQTEKLIHQIRTLKRDKILLDKRNKELLKENRLLAAKNQLMELQIEQLNKEIIILETNYAQPRYE
jgi:hypothetical protein